jgi:hypothetical protein
LVDVLDSFADQPATLTMQPTVVLFGDAWHAHNAPDLWLTTQIRHQRSEQSLDINSVRLGPARPTINLHTCRIDDVVAYALRFEQTAEPEAIIARFVETTSTRFFNSPATRVLIRSISFKSSFQSHGFNV